MLCLTLCLAENAKALVDLQSIRLQVADYVKQNLVNEQDSSQLKVSVGQLDSRLQLSSCNQALALQFHGKQSKRSHILVKVACYGAKPWSIFVPVTVNRYLQVVVASQALIRGQVVQLSDIVLKLQDVSKLNGPYLSRVEQAVGKVAKRAIHAGKALNALTCITSVNVKEARRHIANKLIDEGRYIF